MECEVLPVGEAQTASDIQVQTGEINRGCRPIRVMIRILLVRNRRAHSKRKREVVSMRKRASLPSRDPGRPETVRDDGKPKSFEKAEVYTKINGETEIALIRIVVGYRDILRDRDHGRRQFVVVKST